MEREIITACLFLSVVILLLLLITPFVYADDNSNIERCVEWREKVEGWLEDEGVDKKYFALAVAESRCKPSALSGKGAHGFWQMMGRTMRHYGCDDATDVRCQTKAAAGYLKHLEKMCNHKRECVIKSYNMGGHNYRKYGATNEANGLWMAYKKFVKQLNYEE